MPEPFLTADATRLGSALTEKWAHIEPLVQAGQGRVTPSRVELSKGELDLVKMWSDLFKEEIDAVRKARNYAVHISPTAIPVSDLVEANELAERLLQLLVARVPKLEDVVEVHAPEAPWWDVPDTT
jgi:hypothetical protein